MSNRSQLGEFPAVWNLFLGEQLRRWIKSIYIAKVSPLIDPSIDHAHLVGPLCSGGQLCLGTWVTLETRG